jgi:hypothetical protein
MEGQKIFVIVSTVVNLALFAFAIFMLLNQTNIGLFITLFPLLIGIITFFVLKKGKNFETMRALKYFNIAYFASFLLPVGLFIVFEFFLAPRAVALYGVQVDPVMQQCLDKCRELGNYTSEVVRECINNCIK